MKYNKLTYGASVFDFDETVGYSNNFVLATKKGHNTIKIDSAMWPEVGAKMMGDGFY